MNGNEENKVVCIENRHCTQIAWKQKKREDEMTYYKTTKPWDTGYGMEQNEQREHFQII